MQQPIALLCNPTPNNRKAQRMAETLSHLLAQHRLACELFDRAWPQSLDGFSQAWIVGGDGTLHFFLNKYASNLLPLALFPGGTGNDFHWMLYGKISLEQQVTQVLQGRVRQVDAGVCNGHLFANGLGVGFDGAIVYDLLGKKKWSGQLSYLYSVFKNLAGYRERRCQVSIGEDSFTTDCFMLSAANGQRFGGGFMVGPRAQLTDGLLDISIISRVSLAQRLRYLPIMKKGLHLHLPFVRYQQVKALRIESEHPMHAHLDGEYLKASSFSVHVLPGHSSFLG